MLQSRLFNSRFTLQYNLYTIIHFGHVVYPIGATLLNTVAVTMTYQGEGGGEAGCMCPVPSTGPWWGDLRAAGGVGYAETLKERPNTEHLI